MKRNKCEIDIFTRRLSERIDLDCETCYYDGDNDGECDECWCDESFYEPTDETENKLKPILHGGKQSLEIEDCKNILEILGCGGNNIEQRLLDIINDIYLKASEV